MFGLGIVLVLLVVGYLVGARVERAHFDKLRAREQALADLPTVTLRKVPASWDVERAELVAGNVVVSLDYFKRFIAGLKTIVGGRITTYEPLLDRGRREAQLRMRELAKAQGFDAVINVRLYTSTLANTTGKQGSGGIEMLACGTALKRRRS